MESNTELSLPDAALAAPRFAVGSVLQVSQAGFVRRGHLFFGPNNIILRGGEYEFLDAQAVL